MCVPDSVPSLTHNSQFVAAVIPSKKICEPATRRLRAVTFTTRVVPASVPSVFQIELKA